MNEWPYEVSPLSKDEIYRYCVRDERLRGWQAHRLAMKGLPTGEKLNMLHKWHARWNYWCDERPRDVQVQIDNYVNALLRGGQLVRLPGGQIRVQR